MISRDTVAQYDIPQLQAGVPVNYTINHFSYPFTSHCDSLGMNYCSITMNSNVAEMVTGVGFYFVVTSTPPLPDSAYTIQTGKLNLGDSLLFTSANNFYNLYSTSADSVIFDLKIIGTPTTPFQNYPCWLLYGYNLVDCGKAYGISGVNMHDCYVDDFIGINENKNKLGFYITPNPASDFIIFTSKLKLKHDYELQLINLQGKVIQTEIIPSNTKNIHIEINKLLSGVCIWKIIDPFGFELTGKLFINKNN